MPGPIVCVDTSEIRAGKPEDLKLAIRDLVAFVRANEPRPIAYGVYLDARDTRMTVVQVHPDSASMEFHMQAAGPAFSGFAQLVKLSTMDIYGQPSAALLTQRRRKAAMLGDAAVVVHERHAGFARL